MEDKLSNLANSIIKLLIAENKVVEVGFQGYSAMGNFDVLGPESKAVLKHAFYSGAMHALFSLMVSMTSADDAMAACESLKNEIDAYLKGDKIGNTTD